MTYSRNDLGEIDETTGVLIGPDGKEIKPGLDDDAKRSLQALIDGPKVRHVPSERDNFAAAGGSLEEVPFKAEDTQQSGHLGDLIADTSTAPESKASSIADVAGAEVPPAADAPSQEQQ